MQALCIGQAESFTWFSFLFQQFSHYSSALHDGPFKIGSSLDLKTSLFTFQKRIYESDLEIQ